MDVKIIQEYQHLGTNENYIKAMSNLIIKKQDIILMENFFLQRHNVQINL